MRLKVEDVEVDDPREALIKFKAALAQVVRVPKTAVKRKRATRKKQGKQ